MAPVSQAWALFAPEVPHKNLHVLVRGRLSDGALTPWYDATQYFLDLSKADRLTPTRPLSEGLFHAASIIVWRNTSPQRTASRVVLLRTAAMILELYSAPQRPLALEVQIDETPIGSAPRPLKPKRMVAFDFGWLPVPSHGRFPQF